MAGAAAGPGRQHTDNKHRPIGGRREACRAWPDNEPTRRAHQHTRHHWCGGHRPVQTAWPRCRWAAAGPGRASRSTTPSEARVWRSRGRAAAHRHTQRPGPTALRTPAEPYTAAAQPPGHAKGAGTEVPAPCRLTQPLPRRGSGRMTVSPGDGDASTGTCRQRRPLPGQLHRSGRRSRCVRDAASGPAPRPGRRARRNRSSRQ